MYVRMRIYLSGHYVCIWKTGDSLLLLDDACTARACTASDMDQLSVDAYLLWYIRRQVTGVTD